MEDVFARTFAQGLQAFVPIAVAVVWLRCSGRDELKRAVNAGLIAAAPITLVAAWQFQQSAWQAWWEAIAAIGVTAISLVALRNLTTRRAGDWRIAAGAAAAVIVVRETMLIGATFEAAAIEVRSFDATVAVVSATALALASALAWIAVSRKVAPRRIVNGTIVFAVAFAAYAGFCAVHKSAEARWLPWSGAIDAATEPYGPDSVFGRGVTYLLAAVPMMAASWGVAVIGSGALVTACAVIILTTSGSTVVPALPPESAPAATAVDLIAAGPPRVMFISTALDATYRHVNVAALPATGASAAASIATGVPCERVSFAAGQGICLQAERGLFTKYTAVLLDRAMRPRSSLKLEGSPSRTRVSADGRVGAITVFVSGQAHGYASSSFSTKTVLVDMVGGNVIGDLEQFSTWKDGKRFSAADFNFWGVTFARDSNTFYATLQTAAGVAPVRGQSPQRARTYLVRGELALRRLTILHENVECPSLSPDNHLIAYKKRVGWDKDPWRLFVLDLEAMTEAPIEGESRSIDDQIEWLDDAHVLYAAPRSSDSPITDVYVAPVIGRQPSRVFLSMAQSPIVIR
jgi:hypothetical protein